ncbi:Uncharacterised protein [Streptococcus pneumoniae]|nr:Uncharacterised protein [Streptococcus pneumoniae]
MSLLRLLDNPIQNPFYRRLDRSDRGLNIMRQLSNHQALFSFAFFQGIKAYLQIMGHLIKSLP